MQKGDGGRGDLVAGLQSLYTLGDAKQFDAATLLDAAMLAEFVERTQPKEYAKLCKQFPGGAAHGLGRARGEPDPERRGTLEVLRNGALFSGVNLQLAYFRPSAGGNPEHQVRYEGNRFAVLRQVHYSTRAPGLSVDVAILLNGLPIASLELKNHFTGQNVQHAIAQYGSRDAEELFWGRCLVHFAADDDAVHMTTRGAGG